MSSRKHFDVQSEDGLVVLRLEDPYSYDTSDYGDLQLKLFQFVEEVRPQLLVVDFQNVAYCSTATINALIQVRRRLAAYGGQLKLSGLSTEVREAFRCMNLEGTIFSIYDTPEAATADR
jgi:anti-anti-sigma factor